MKNTKRFCFFLFGVVLIYCSDFSLAGDTTNADGWEKGSLYNRLYKSDETDSFKGEVRDIVEVIPMKGMSPGLALSVKESEGDTTLVHLCPIWYKDVKSIGIKKGDRVKIKGAWAEIDGEDIFMASKVKKGDFFEFKVRLTKDGSPFWAMTPEELAAEKKAGTD